MHKSRITRLFLVLFCLLLGACASTRPLGEWIAPEYGGESSRNLLVIAAIDRSTRRRAFEEYLVDLLKIAGAEASPSHQLLTASLKLSRAGLEQAIARRGFDGVLVLRMTMVDPDDSYQDPGVTAESLYAYHDRAFDEAAKMGRRAPTVIETSLFDARSGRLQWSMQSAVMEPSQPRDFIEAHLIGVIDRLQQIGMLAAIAVEATTE